MIMVINIFIFKPFSELIIIQDEFEEEELLNQFVCSNLKGLCMECMLVYKEQQI